MKWLIIQSDGLHKGQDDWSPNWFLRECYGLRDALKRHGHEADIWGLRHVNFEQTPDFNSYDAVLLVENYEMGWLPDFRKMTKPVKLQWIIDLHCQDWNNYYPWSEQMDVVLHSTQTFVPIYEKHVPRARHYWFPNAIDDRYFRVIITGGSSEVRQNDIVFIGGKGPRREKVIDRMVAEVGMYYGYGITGIPYIGSLQHSKIGFNKNIGDDINYRTFETIACGACLLTERNYHLEKLGFVDGVNCVLYENDDHAIQRAKELLASGDWQRIGLAGVELAKRHSYFERLNLIRGML